MRKNKKTTKKSKNNKDFSFNISFNEKDIPDLEDLGCMLLGGIPEKRIKKVKKRKVKNAKKKT